MKTTTGLLIPYPEPTDPPDGAAQMQGIADRVDLMVPRGVIKEVWSRTRQTGLTATAVDLTGTAITFTAQAARRYRINFGATLGAASAGAYCSVILATSANAVYKQATGDASTSNADYGITLSAAVTLSKASGSPLAAGTYSFKLRGQIMGSGGTCEASSDPSFVVVEDLGADP